MMTTGREMNNMVLCTSYKSVQDREMLLHVRHLIKAPVAVSTPRLPEFQTSKYKQMDGGQRSEADTLFVLDATNLAKMGKNSTQVGFCLV